MRCFLTLPAFDLKVLHCNGDCLRCAVFSSPVTQQRLGRQSWNFQRVLPPCFYKYWVSSSLSPNLVNHQIPPYVLFSAVLSCQVCCTTDALLMSAPKQIQTFPMHLHMSLGDFVCIFCAACKVALALRRHLRFGWDSFGRTAPVSTCHSSRVDCFCQHPYSIGFRSCSRRCLSISSLSKSCIGVDAFLSIALFPKQNTIQVMVVNGMFVLSCRIKSRGARFVIDCVFLIDTFFVVFRSFWVRCTGLIVPEDLF